MPTASSSRAKPASTRSTRATAAQSSADDLAQKLASKLTIGGSNDKGKAKAVASEKPPSKSTTMRNVNAASQSLSVVMQSGWKASSTEAKSSAADKVKKLAGTLKDGFIELRKLCPDDVDVERAASSVVSKLIALETFELAVGMLSGMQRQLLHLSNAKAEVDADGSALLSLPLDILNEPPSETLLPLMLTYLSQSIISQCHRVSDDLPAFSSSLFKEPTILLWAPHILDKLPRKLTDATITRTYTHLVKATSSLTSSNPPEAVFSTRLYAASCLLYTSPGTMDSKAYWEQTAKFGVAFAKSATTIKAQDVSRIVSNAYSELLDRAEQCEISKHFLNGPGYISFCEIWTSFAKKASDLVTLKRISQLMLNASTTSGSESVLKDQKSQSPSRTLQCAQVGTTLAQVLTLLEETPLGSTDILVKSLRETKLALESLDTGRLLQAEGGEDQLQALDKVLRSVESLRKIASRLLEGQPVKDVKLAQELRSVLETCSTTFKGALEQHPQGLHLTRLLETCFVLARTALVTSDVSTCARAHGYLEQAKSSLDAIGTLKDVDIPNYYRCLSQVHYFLAAKLYQHGHHASVVQFLEDACTLGAQALRTGPDLLSEAIDDTIRQGWKQLQEQLYRRWELLGVCYSKVGDRQKAYDAFVSSIKSFPFTVTGFDKTASTTPPLIVFDVSPAVKQLGVLVDRVAYLATFELLLDPSHIPLTLALDGLGAGIIGLVHERQLASLEGSLWKENAREASRALLKEAWALYEKSQMPVRSARVLLRYLSFAYQVGQREFTSSEGWPFETLGQVADGIETRCNAENLHRDEHFKPYCSQYRVAAHLWTLLHAHRSGQSTSSNITLHAQKACAILQPPSPLSPKRGLRSRIAKMPSPKTQRTSGQIGRQPVRRSARAPVSSKAKPTAIPVTPKPKAKKELQNLVLNAPTSPPVASAGKPTNAFDDLDGFINLIKTSGSLLGLLGMIPPKIQLLSLVRRLMEQNQMSSNEGYIDLCVELASDCFKLGKVKKAQRVFAQISASLKTNAASDETLVQFHLKRAEFLAGGGHVLESASSYCEALSLADKILPEAKNAPTADRVRERVKRVMRAANAASVYSRIQTCKDDSNTSIRGLLQSLRLWNRAADSLARLVSNPSPTKSGSEPDPFNMADIKDALPTAQPSAEPAKPPTPHILHSPLDGLEWQVAEGLTNTLIQLSETYFQRGSPREAEYFAQQAQDLARSLNSPSMLAHALGLKAAVYIAQSQMDQAQAALLEAADLLHSAPGLVAATIQKIMADFNRKAAHVTDADELYGKAIQALEKLDSALGAMDGIVSGPRQSLGLSPSTMQSKEILAPILLACVLRERILLHQETSSDVVSTMLDALLALPKMPQIQVEENALMAKLSLDNVHQQFQLDMFLNSIHESTIALPTQVADETTVLQGVQKSLVALKGAEKLYLSDLALVAKTGKVSHVRESAISLALIQAYQSSLGQSGAEGCSMALKLLDFAANLSLRREMLDTIATKFSSGQFADDLQWPAMTPTGSFLENKRMSSLLSRFSIEDDDEDDDKHTRHKNYWNSIRTKYERLTNNTLDVTPSGIADLPVHWTVVHISITEDKRTLFISRQQGSGCIHLKESDSCNCPQDPLMFCVPLKDRRDGGAVGMGDDPLSYEDAMKELNDIVTSSDNGARCAVDIKNSGDSDARKQWWSTRVDLDSRMKTLLEDIEFCWLGAFKSILRPRLELSSSNIKYLRDQFAKVIQRSLFPVGDKKLKQARASLQSSSQNIILDDSLIECFSSLSPKCRDEELEDLVYFILDFYQFHNIPVAVSEVDVDQAVVDLRSILEDCATMRSKLPTLADEHIFLILDKNLQSIPWESLPALRGRSVGRIPNLDLLRDRVELARSRGGVERGVDGRINIDPRKTFYVINPSGDLSKTEGRFRDWLTAMKSVGWQGICGVPPTELEMLNALSRNDLMIYFGHGGGEQYVRSHKIRALQSCAATMLWGCSSGALKEMGDFDRVGTPYHYLMAGCPTLVANLWDVTDRDIDKFSQSVFDKLGLTPSAIGKGRGKDAQVSAIRSVAQSRDSCKLKYLTGAAPVVYGIPFYV